MGFLPRQEVAREVAYAHEQGLDSFAALAPNSPYGHLMGDALKDRIGERRQRRQRSNISIRAPPTSRRRSSACCPAAARGQRRAPPCRRAPVRRAAAAGRRRPGSSRSPRQLKAAGVDPSRTLLGSGFGTTPAIVSDPALVGGWFAARRPKCGRISSGASTRPRPSPAASRLARLRCRGARRGAGQKRRPRPVLGAGDPRTRAASPGSTGCSVSRRKGLVQRGLAVLEVEPLGTRSSARRRRASRMLATELV